MGKEHRVARESAGHDRLEALEATLPGNEFAEVCSRQVERPTLFGECGQGHDVEAGDAVACRHDHQQRVGRQWKDRDRRSQKRAVMFVDGEDDIAEPPVQGGRAFAWFDLEHFDRESRMRVLKSAYSVEQNRLDRTGESSHPQVARCAARDIQEFGLDGVEVIANIACSLREHPPRRSNAQTASGALEELRSRFVLENGELLRDRRRTEQQFRRDTAHRADAFEHVEQPKPPGVQGHTAQPTVRRSRTDRSRNGYRPAHLAVDTVGT